MVLISLAESLGWAAAFSTASTRCFQASNGALPESGWRIGSHTGELWAFAAVSGGIGYFVTP